MLDVPVHLIETMQYYRRLRHPSQVPRDDSPVELLRKHPSQSQLLPWYQRKSKKMAVKVLRKGLVKLFTVISTVFDVSFYNMHSYLNDAQKPADSSISFLDWMIL
jgi:hypothetical protein